MDFEVLDLRWPGEDGSMRIFEVWDSREQAEAWGDRVMAVRTETGFGDVADATVQAARQGMQLVVDAGALALVWRRSMNDT